MPVELPTWQGSFASPRMTRLRVTVIPGAAKDLVVVFRMYAYDACMILHSISSVM